MKINNLSEGTKEYTSNVYMLTGGWNAITDINTLVDVGRDPFIIAKIEDANSGVGKNRVEQVIITHNHYDHSGLLPEIVERYKPKVYACSKELELVDVVLRGGEILRVADMYCEVIFTPGHSSDSICLYCKEEKTIFAGDTPLIIQAKDNKYEDSFVQALEYIASKDIEKIFFGHGPPLTKDCNIMLKSSLENIKR